MIAQRQFSFNLPMRISTSAKKKHALNLNVYRNLHFRSLSAQKNIFHKMMEKLLHGLPTLGRITLHYDVCPKTKVDLDVMNVGSIVDKYFSDSLVNLNKIEDDNHRFINFVSFGFGGLSKEEHVRVTITEIEPRKGNVMRILLDEDEIQTALEDFVSTLGLTGVSGVELTADEDGNVTAEVLLGETKASPTKRTPSTVAPKKSRGGRPAGSKNKPKDEDDDVSTTGEDSDDSNSAGAVEQPEDIIEEKASKSSSSKGGASKNLFGESPETSSEDGDEGDSPETKEDSGEAESKAAKRPSIFDQ